MIYKWLQLSFSLVSLPPILVEVLASYFAVTIWLSFNVQVFCFVRFSIVLIPPVFVQVPNCTPPVQVMAQTTSFHTLISSFVRCVNLFLSTYRFISFIAYLHIWFGLLIPQAQLCLFLIDNCLVHCFSQVPFIWRKVVQGKRVILLAESTLPSVYMREELTPLPESRAGFAMTTVRAHALVVSP